VSNSTRSSAVRHSHIAFSACIATGQFSHITLSYLILSLSCVVFSSCWSWRVCNSSVSFVSHVTSYYHSILASFLGHSGFFISTESRDWLGRMSAKCPILCRVGCKTPYYLGHSNILLEMQIFFKPHSMCVSGVRMLKKHWLQLMTFQCWHTHWVTLSFADTKSQALVWDLINMQNVLNHISHWSPHLTGKDRKK